MSAAPLTVTPSYVRQLDAQEWHGWQRVPGFRAELVRETERRATSWAHDGDVEGDVAIVIVSPHGHAIEGWSLVWSRCPEHGRQWQCEERCEMEVVL